LLVLIVIGVLFWQALDVFGALKTNGEFCITGSECISGSCGARPGIDLSVRCYDSSASKCDSCGSWWDCSSGNCISGKCADCEADYARSCLGTAVTTCGSQWQTGVLESRCCADGVTCLSVLQWKATTCSSVSDCTDLSTTLSCPEGNKTIWYSKRLTGVWGSFPNTCNTDCNGTCVEWEYNSSSCGGGCTPSCPSSSTYCPGSEPSDGCGGTCSTGTATPSCPSTSTYCAGNEPNDGCGGTCPTGTQPPTCPAPSTYCVGNEPDNGCGGTCPNGTKDCTGPPPPPLPIATEFLRIWDGSKIIKLIVKSVTDAIATSKGVVKVAMINGDTNSALDLVETGEADASGIRIRTPYGTKSCRKAMDFCQVIAGSGYIESGTDVVATYDGGYAMVGNNNNDGGDLLLFKFKADGTLDWTRMIGGPANDADTAESLMQTADGSLIVLGTTQSYGQGSTDLFLLKFSSTGTFIWAKTFGTSNYERASSISPTSDGGYIVSGLSGVPLGILLVRFFGDDSLAWARNITENGPYTSIYPSSYPNSVIQVSDGNYLVAGTLYSDSYGRAAFIKVSEDGSSVLFGKAVYRWFTGMIYRLVGNSVVEAADNNSYILAGYIDCTNCSSANGQGMYAKFNSTDGTFVWAKNTSMGVADAYITSIINTVDGGYALSGAGGYHAIRITSSILRLDSAGNRIWMKTLPKVLTIPYMANSLAQTIDGGFVAVGTKSSDALIYKVDDEGLACFGNDFGSSTINSGSNYSQISFNVAMSNATLIQQSIASPVITSGVSYGEYNCCNE